MRTHEPRTTDGAPPAVRSAYWLWLAAVAFGVFEMVLVIANELVHGAGPGELAAGATVRVAVFAVAVALALRMRAGSRWARLLLTVLLGVLGLGSLLIGPVEAVLAGQVALPTGTVDWMFTASRVAHISAVIAALVAMFHPSAHGWFTTGAA